MLVGFHRDFDYERLRIAATAVINGARLIGTNDDATYPTPDGPIPGGGAILAAVATASGVVPVIAGKPYAPMAELVRRAVGPGFDPRRDGDGRRPSLDRRPVRRGDRVSVRDRPHRRDGPGAPLQTAPWLDADDLAAVADVLVAES